MIRAALVILLLGTLSACEIAIERAGALSYEPREEYPFGRPHPEAPEELQQFSFMIGQNDCTEERLDNGSGEWRPGLRTWDAHYYMNGNAIRDSGISGNATNGNIRIFDSNSEQWHVTFFSSPVYGSGTWSGGLVDDRIELEQPQLAPGTTIEGINRLTFYNITNASFDWKGEWLSLDGTVVFPYWRISCQKQI